LHHPPVITIISDWKDSDYYLGAVKGKILQLCPDVSIIDINHRITPFNVVQAAFISRNTYFHYPKGTIHLITVNSTRNSDQTCLATEHNGHFFLVHDNGCLSLMFEDTPKTIIQINTGKNINPLFKTLDVFTNAAIHLAKKGKLSELGKPVKDIQRSTQLRPAIDNNSISANVIYIDSYYNAITNVTSAIFERTRKERKFTIFIQSNKYKISTISSHYSEVPAGEFVAVFNSAKLLELAMNSGNLAELLGLSIGSSIIIKFNN
jgi:hypothetical protein